MEKNDNKVKFMTMTQELEEYILFLVLKALKVKWIHFTYNLNGLAYLTALCGTAPTI